MHSRMRHLFTTTFALLILMSMNFNWVLAQSLASLNEAQKLIAGEDGDPGDNFGHPFL